ncbi:MAG: hypothetical protein WD771_11755 [Gemmatimonadaceae bacterium]
MSFRTPVTWSLIVLAALGVSAGAQERPATPERLPTSERPPEAGQPRQREAPVIPVGTFVATLIDRDTLPLADRVVDNDGTLYVIEFDRLVLSLQADFRFRAAVRYRRTLFAGDTHGRSRPTPLQSMNVAGTFEIVLDGIRFFPDPSSDTRGLKMLSGTVRGLRELTIPFHYRNGTQQRERTLVMRRRDDFL